MKLPLYNPEKAGKPKTIEEIDSLFEKILSVDLENPDYNKVKNAFFENVDFLPFVNAPFDRKTLKELPLYRTRPAWQIKDKELGNATTFGAPPIDKDVGIQRASWKCRNVFYGGDSFETALLESKRMDEGNEFYVSKWLFDLDRLKDETYDFRVLFDSELPSNNPWINFTNGFTGLLESHKERYGEEATVELAYLHKKFCDLFLIEDKKYYPLTAFLTDYQIYSKYNTQNVVFFPFVIYPSVENNRMSCNFAIHPLFVRNYMYLDTVSHVKVLKSKGDKPELEFIKFGKCDDRTKVNWYTSDLDLDKANWYIEYVACTNCGRIIWNKDFKNCKFMLRDTNVDIHKKVGIIIRQELDKILDNIKIREWDFKEMIILTRFFNLEDYKLIDDETHDKIFVKIKIGIPLIYNEV